MLRRHRWVSAVIPPSVAVIATLILIATPAAADDPWDPDNPCVVDPDSIECEEYNGNTDDGPTSCSYRGQKVPCTSPYGHGYWVGDLSRSGTGWLFLGYEAYPADSLSGCWALRNSQQAEDWMTGGGTPPGSWYTLHCLEGQTWPVSASDLVWASGWRLDGDNPVDPEELARRALAELDIQEPVLRLAPPPTGVVPLGIPVWLAVEESQESWGPLSNSACDGTLCVSIDARVVRTDWQMGDGTELVTCHRGQNRPWQVGMDYRQPGDACHHYYYRPSRSQPEGRFDVTATLHWETTWEGGGQTGTLPSTQETSTSLNVVEIQVLVTTP